MLAVYLFSDFQLTILWRPSRYERLSLLYTDREYCIGIKDTGSETP